MAFTPKINGYEIPKGHVLPPEVGIEALDKDSKRTTSGLMIRYFIGDKRKLSFELKGVPIQVGKQILEQVKGKSCLIEYDDAELGIVTKRFYVTSRQSRKYPSVDAFEYIKFNAIEV